MSDKKMPQKFETVMVQKSGKKFLVVKKFLHGNAAVCYYYKESQRLPGKLMTRNEAENLIERLIGKSPEFQIFGDAAAILLDELKTNKRMFI